MIIPIEKDAIYNMKIRSETGRNEGIGHIEGFPIYVKNAKKGEKIKVKIVDIKKHYAIGEKR